MRWPCGARPAERLSSSRKPTGDFFHAATTSIRAMGRERTAGPRARCPAEGAGGRRLPDPADQGDRVVGRRRAGRRHRAHHRRTHRQAAGPAGAHRPEAGCQRCHCRVLRGQGAGRRPHAAVRRQLLRARAAADGQARLRRVQGLRARVAVELRPARVRGGRGRAREEHARVRRHGQGAARQAELRLGGAGLVGPPLRREAHARRGPADDARALQGRRAADDRHPRRPGAGRLRHHGRGAAAREVGPREIAGRVRHAPHAARAADPHLHRAGLQGLRARRLLGLLRAHRHAAAGHRQARRRGAPGRGAA
ncbi:hypothetical protein D9M72_195690 [compost metagenome]